MTGYQKMSEGFICSSRPDDLCKGLMHRIILIRLFLVTVSAPRCVTGSTAGPCRWSKECGTDSYPKPNVTGWVAEGSSVRLKIEK